MKDEREPVILSSFILSLFIYLFNFAIESGYIELMKQGDNIRNGRVVLKAEACDCLNREYRFTVEFFVFQENGVYIAYCPSLDISSSGETFNDAISSFYEMFQLHIECCIENKTLYDDLLAHGWRLQKKHIVPPTFSALMKKPEMKKLMNSNVGFEKVVVPARIPAFA